MDGRLELGREAALHLGLEAAHHDGLQHAVRAREGAVVHLAVRQVEGVVEVLRAGLDWQHRREEKV